MGTDHKQQLAAAAAVPGESLILLRRACESRYTGAADCRFRRSVFLDSFYHPPSSVVVASADFNPVKASL